MIKREELTNPASCMSRASNNEMTFVLLARDAAAPVAIRAWVAERIRIGKNTINDEQIKEALHCAGYMDQQRRDRIGLDRTAPPVVDSGAITAEEEKKHGDVRVPQPLPSSPTETATQYPSELLAARIAKIRETVHIARAAYPHSDKWLNMYADDVEDMLRLIDSFYSLAIGASF